MKLFRDLIFYVSLKSKLSLFIYLNIHLSVDLKFYFKLNIILLF